MKEIQIGEYGRTNLGKIIKFAWLENSQGKRYEDKVLLIKDNRIVNKFYYFNKNESIVKHSKNIMDLIEVGDFVNGKEVKHIALFEGFPDYPKLIFTDERNVLPHETCENDEIKTILTHEQIENNCFRIGE